MIRTSLQFDLEHYSLDIIQVKKLRMYMCTYIYVYTYTCTHCICMFIKSSSKYLYEYINLRNVII